MRKKKGKSLDASNLTEAWSAFFNGTAISDPVELKKEGWMTNSEIAEQSKLEGEAGRQIANIAFRRGVLEKKVAKILVSGRRTNVNFYRPIL